MIRFNPIDLKIAVAIIGEWAAILFFSRRLESEQKIFWHRVSNCLLLLVLLPIYLINSNNDIIAERFLNQLVRTLYHYVVVAGYLMANKQKTFSVSAYIAGIYISIYLAAFNVKNITAFLMGTDVVVGGLNVVAVLFFFIYLTWKILDFNDIRIVGILRYWVLAISIVSGIYIKRYMIGMQMMSHRSGYWIDQLLIPSIGLLSIMGMLLMFERSMVLVEKEQRIHMDQMRQDYELQNARRALQAGTDIRHMYHDMKNHLMAVQTMIESNQPAKEYLADIVSEFSVYESLIQTGNSIVDGILTEKISRARMDGVDFNVYVDLRSLSFIQALDLVTIFGNALDNAIEALRNVTKEERIAYIKSFTYGNVIVLQFSNRYEGELIKEKGQFHGIGLKSIRKATEKYGGSVITEIDHEEKCFRLAVLIPCKE